MGFDFFENSIGNVLPNTENNLELIKVYREIMEYKEKMKFWDSHGLTRINYQLRDIYGEKTLEQIPDSNFEINPKGRDEWILYYEWQRDKRIAEMMIEFEITLLRFKQKSQKEEFKTQILADIDEKLKILNPNPVYNERRDTKYAYDCEVKGLTPIRKHFPIQIDSATIFGGALYHFKHTVLKYQFKEGKETKKIVFFDLFVKPELYEVTLQLFRDLHLITTGNQFIKSNKGFFPHWIKWCQKNSLIKADLDNVDYRNALVNEIKGLKLSPKFVEFNTEYKTLDKKTIDLKFIQHYKEYLRN